MADGGIGFSFSLEGADRAIDAAGRLFLTIWEKSPTFVWFCAIMSFMAVFYWIHTRRERHQEQALNRKVKDLRSKRRAKKASQEKGSR